MYDVFISYTSRDKEFVNGLATDLMESGVKVWFAEWEMKPGDSLLKKISDGIKDSSFLFVVLSPNSVSSRWVEQEVRQAITEEIYSNKVKVVPILYRKCNIPDYLKDKVYVDFSEGDPEEYNLQKLIDVVFGDHDPLDQSLEQSELIDEYESIIQEKRPDPIAFLRVSRALINVIQKNLASSGGYEYIPEPFRFHLFLKEAEINLTINELHRALELYQNAYLYSKYQEDLRLVLRCSIPLACINAYLRRVEEATNVFESIFQAVQEDLGEEEVINLAAIVEYTVQVCFFEHLGMTNPLDLVFKGDHHRLNIRIRYVMDAMYASLKVFAESEEDEKVLSLEFANLLNHYGTLRPALKFYKIASELGHPEADSKHLEVRSSQESAMFMAKYIFGPHGQKPPPPDYEMKSLSLSHPAAFRRVLICSGVYLDLENALEDVFSNLNEENEEVEETDFIEEAVWDNGVFPTRILIYEDYPGSSVGVRFVVKLIQEPHWANRARSRCESGPR